MYKSKVALSSILLLLISVSSVAQWMEITLDGGETNTIVKTNNFLFSTNNKGLYFSSFDPINWNKISNNLFDEMEFYDAAISLNNFNNLIFLYKKNSSNEVLYSTDIGITWKKQVLATNYFIHSSFIFKDTLYLNTHLLGSTDINSTVIYKYVSDKWIEQVRFNLRFAIEATKDTLYFINTNDTKQWFISTNLINTSVYGPDLFRNNLTNITQHKNRFYGILNKKFLYYSAFLGSWKNIVEIPTGQTISNISFVDSILFISSYAQNKFYLYYYDFVGEKLIPLNNPNCDYKSIIHHHGKYYFNSRFGLYEFNLNGSWTYKMDGYKSSVKSSVLEFDKRLYISHQNLLYYSDNNGKDWEVFNTDLGPETILSSIKFKNNIFIIKNKQLYAITNKNLTIEELLGIDSNLINPSYLGEDDTYVYIEFTNKATYKSYYYRIDGALSTSALTALNPPYNQPMSCIYAEKDTLFGFSYNPSIQYYSLNHGNTWNNYKLNTLVNKDHFVNRVYKLGDVLLAFFSDESRLGNNSITAYRKNSNWSPVTGYLYKFQLRFMFEKQNRIYLFNARDTLYFSNDSIKTIKNTGINFDVFSNRSISSINVVDNKIFVSLNSSGVWTNTINVNTGIEKANTDNFIIYPNPAHTTITIQSSNTISALSIYNMQGVLVFEIENLETNTFSVEQLPKGMYVVKTKYGVGRFVKL
jgi:hypothetical protein